MNDNELKKFVLQTIGENSNIDFEDESSEVVIKMNLIYENLIKQSLSRYEWGFAVQTIKLEDRIELNDYKFKYSYTLPLDFVVLLNIFTNKNENFSIKEYRLLGKTIDANENDLYLKYIKRIDTENFPSYFIEYLRVKIAFELCFTLTGDTDLLKILSEKEKFEYKNAVNIDSMQRPSRIIKNSPYITARFS